MNPETVKVCPWCKKNFKTRIFRKKWCSYECADNTRHLLIRREAWRLSDWEKEKLKELRKVMRK